MILTAHPWMDFCAMIERPDWLEDRELFPVMRSQRLGGRAFRDHRSLDDAPHDS